MLKFLSSMVAARLRFGILAGVILAFFASYPQMKLLYNTGGSWQGHYAYNDIDEVAYAAYLKALIDGRPRRNDPYSGRDDSPEDPQPESLFSIQFAAPYALALPARILGMGASAAMYIGGAAAAFLAGLFCFLLLARITGEDWLAFAAALAVLAGGALAAGEGAIGEILGTGFSYPYFPFLRRYVPAVPFPAFLLFLLCVREMFATEDGRRRSLYCVAASLCFSFTMFSYFYIWTTAAAFIPVIGLVWIAFRPDGWKKDVAGLAALGAACVIPTLFYAAMLARRSDTLDQVQLLVHTRMPDLLRVPEYVAAVSIIVLAAGAAFKRIDPRSKSFLFTLSAALVPFVLFNQQIVTGRSLQPIHYQVFIGNYVAALSFCLSAILFFRDSLRQRVPVKAAAAACFATGFAVWGIVECHYTVRVLDEANIARDSFIPVARELSRMSQGSEYRFSETIFSPANIHGDDSPTVAPQNVLWTRHQHVFPGLTWQENKERYYRQLYYQGLDEAWLEKRLKQGDFVSMIALFGWGRHTDRLSSDAKPLTFAEIEEESARFGRFAREFGPEQAYEPELSYAVIPKSWNVNLENVKKWYEISEEVEAGGHTVLRLERKRDD